jgi:hypothetical protein
MEGVDDNSLSEKKRRDVPAVDVMLLVCTSEVLGRQAGDTTFKQTQI